MGSYSCSGDGATVVMNNSLFTSDGTAQWHCGTPEPGSTVSFYPAADEIIEWAKGNLGMQD
jgi:hypothetical protein